MGYLKKAMLLVLLPLLAFGVAHKFYLSVTTVDYSENDRALQISSRVFIDDMDKLLQERYGLKANLATKDESSQANDFIEKYFRAKLAISVNGKEVAYHYLGKKYDNDLMICFLEIPGVDLDTLSSVAVQNEVLMDYFEEQKNVVHIRVKGEKKSFVLIRENNKGMLNLK